jgi:hypothetical protein
MKETYEALESAAIDLYGFGMVCNGASAVAAEPEILDVMLLGLENAWFTEGDSGRLTHTEFREEFFRILWERSRGRRTPVRIGTDVPLGHEEMAFYQLPQLARAALYLRSKKRFPYPSIAMILGTPESRLQEEIERAREFLLGRRVSSPEWSEEDF